MPEQIKYILAQRRSDAKVNINLSNDSPAL